MEPVQPTQPTGSGSPTQGLPAVILDAFKRVLARPSEFYASVKDQAGLGPPLVFALAMGVAAGVITAVLSLVGLRGAAGALAGAAVGFGAILLSPIFTMIGVVIGGAVAHVISLIAGGKGTFEQSLRVAAYASAVMPIAALVGFVPLVNILPSLYGLYLVAIGLVVVHAADRRKTFISVAVLGALLVLMTISSLLAMRAARSAATDLDKAFGPGSKFQQDLAKGAEQLQRAAEEARKAAEEAAKKKDR